MRQPGAGYPSICTSTSSRPVTLRHYIHIPSPPPPAPPILATTTTTHLQFHHHHHHRRQVLLVSPERIVLSGGVMQRAMLFPKVSLHSISAWQHSMGA